MLFRSVAELGCNCALLASCRRVKPLGDGGCRLRTAFVCDNLCLSVRGEDNRSINVGTCKTLDDRLEIER